MSKSVRRVEAALAAAGLAADVVRLEDETRTAPQAAAAVGCELDQIVKSVIFAGSDSGRIYLFITAGGNRIALEPAARAAGEPLGKADADRVRATTGFAIGGVAPIGHLTPVTAFFDARLLDFPRVWAAAGTPHHVFSIAPRALLDLSGATLAPFTDGAASQWQHL